MLVRRVFGLLRPREKRSFVWVFLILGISALLSQVLPLAVGYLTDDILVGDGVAFARAVPVLLLILVTTIVNEVIKVIRRLLVERAATQAEKNGRTLAAESLLHAPMGYFRQNMTGNIHGRLNRSLEGVTRLIKLVSMDFAPAVFNGIAAIGVIFAKLPVGVALLMLLVLPLGTLIVLRQIHTQKGIRVELMESKSELDGTMVELLGGIETIRSLNSADGECERIGERSGQLRSKEMKHHYAMAGYDCLKFINEAVFHVLVIGTTVLLAARGTITVGTVLTAYLCFTQLTGPLRELHRILDEASECAVLAEDYFRLLDLPRDFSYETEQGQGTPEEGGISVENLCLSYAEKPDRPVLRGISLDIAPGSFVGVAGPSGGGKSTFIKALDKLEPAEGTVIVGGRDLRSLTRQELAELVVLVPQRPFLIAGSIYRNICYGLPDGVPLEEVRRAARRASIADDIEKMPGGYDFVVAEGGHNLSGGQCQRIALARVFLRKPRILILDEATSALDNTSEKKIQAELESLKAECGTTILSIAHRLTTLRNCDEIVVVDQGRIVQRGTYEALLQQPGLFRDMSAGVVH